MKLSFVIFFSFLLNTAFAQYKLQWYSAYNDQFYFDDAAGVVQDNHGNTYITGRSYGLGDGAPYYDIVTIKYGSSGDSIWVKRYSTANSPTCYDEPVNIVLSNDSNLIIAGRNYLNTDLNRAAILFKYDLNGNLVWQSRYYEQNHSNVVENFVQDGYGNIYVLGSDNSLDGGFAKLFKHSSDGKLVWDTVYSENDSTWNMFACAVIDIHNNIVLTGYSGASSEDFITVKYDSSGNLLWSSNLNDAGNNFGLSVVTDNNGNCYVAGYTNYQNHWNLELIKYDIDGNLIWRKIYPAWSDLSFKGYGYFIPELLKTDSEDNLYLNYTAFRNSKRVIGLIKLNSSGTELWTNYYDPDSSILNIASDFKITSSGKIFAAGYSVIGNSTNTFVILEYDVNGNLLSITRNMDQIPYKFQPFAISVSNSEDIALTGSALYFGNDTRILTMKYSKAVGVQQLGSYQVSDFRLLQNFPNPFNPSTKIRFRIASNVRTQTSDVKLVVYNSIGEEVAVLVNGDLNAGSFEVDFNSDGLPSGVYFYKLTAGSFSETRRMVLLK